MLKTIKRQIAEYAISAEELGFSRNAPAGIRGRKAAASEAGRKPDREAGVRGRHPSSGSKPLRYRDHDGNTCTGRGKQPKWAVAALASGRSLESLLIQYPATST